MAKKKSVSDRWGNYDERRRAVDLASRISEEEQLSPLRTKVVEAQAANTRAVDAHEVAKEIGRLTVKRIDDIETTAANLNAATVEYERELKASNERRCEVLLPFEQERIGLLKESAN